MRFRLVFVGLSPRSYHPDKIHISNNALLGVAQLLALLPVFAGFHLLPAFFSSTLHGLYGGERRLLRAAGPVALDGAALDLGHFGAGAAAAASCVRVPVARGPVPGLAWLPGMCSTDAVAAMAERASCQLLAAEGWTGAAARMHGGLAA